MHCGLYKPQYKKFINTLPIVQPTIHLEKFILTVCTTRNVKNAKK